MDVKSLIWTEKYRPSKVSDIVGDFKDKILSYLKDPKAIPNFLFYSKAPGTGKCLGKDEMFLSKNGLSSFEEYIIKNNIVGEITNKQISVLDIDKKIVSSSYIYRGFSGTIKIVTKNGFDLTGTREHKIKIFDVREGVVWKKLSDIKIGDLAIINYGTNIFGEEIFDYKKFDMLINILKKKRSMNSLKDIRKPIKMNKDIAFLLGTIVANGSVYKNHLIISTQKKWLQDKIVKIFNDEFFCHVSLINDKRKNIITACSIGSKEFLYFLEYVCGYKFLTARFKQCPKIIFKTNKENQISFLNGLFEDGYFGKEEFIDYYTASDKLAKEIHLLLLNMGYVASRREKRVKKYNHIYWKVTICVEHSLQLIKQLDGKFKDIKIVNSGLERNTNLLGYGRNIMNYVRNKRKELHITKHSLFIKKALQYRKIHKGIYAVKKDIKKLINDEPYLDVLTIFLDNDLLLEPIKRIVDGGAQQVYDFHIPETHSFLTSGFISHNTTLAKAIVNEIGCDYILINSSDDRTMEVIRDKVKEFAKSKSSKEGLKRCVFMDEADGNLRQSQEALRATMETYASNCFFILTCNSVNKIIDPIRSRCIEIPFAYPKKEEIKQYLIKICETEKIDYSDDGLNALIDRFYPSIRDMVLILQDLFTEKKQLVPDNVKLPNELFESLWKIMEEKDWRKIKEIVMSSTVDARELNEYFWRKSVESDNLKVLQLACRNERDMAAGADSKVIFISSLIEMVK
jgi:DNA polymerase III delta prime subunit